MWIVPFKYFFCPNRIEVVYIELPNKKYRSSGTTSKNLSNRSDKHQLFRGKTKQIPYDV